MLFIQRLSFKHIQNVLGLVMVLLLVGFAVVTPPPHLPDLFPALFALFSATILILFYFYFTAWQLSLSLKSVAAEAKKWSFSGDHASCIRQVFKSKTPHRCNWALDQNYDHDYVCNIISFHQFTQVCAGVPACPGLSHNLTYQFVLFY